MAVYTEVSDEEVIDFVAAYDIGDVVALKGIAEGVENSNFLLQTTQGSYILTLYEKRVRAEDLPFFLSLMSHLQSKGIPCPLPLATSDGEQLRSLCGRPACLTTFLEGMWPRKIKPFHLSELGAALGRFHLEGADFDMVRANNLSISGWRPLFELSRERAHEVRGDLCDILQQELDFLEANWPADLPFGVCHADLFPDNVFFIGDKLSGLIDFYFACNDFYAYDLGICLNAWCFEKDSSFNTTKARNLLTAYSKVRPLTQEELDALPILARGSAVRFLLTRLYDWLHGPKDALVRPKDPVEYLNILRFHQGVSDVAAYGLDPRQCLEPASS